MRDALEKSEDSVSRWSTPAKGWLACIVVLIVLHVDVWAWDNQTRVLLVPRWVLYSMGLQVALAFCLFRLGRELPS